MLRTKVEVSFFIPTTSVSRYVDAITAVKAAVDENKGEGFFATMSGPHGSHGTETSRGENGKGQDTGPGSGGVGRSRADDAADAFDGDGDGKPVEPVKRGRGRPPKARPPEGDGKRDDSAGSGGTEGTRGNVSERTREGSDKGSGQGEGRSGSSGGSRQGERGNREASRVKDEPAWDDDAGGDEDWADTASEGEDWHAKTPGDEWPPHLMPEGEIDKTVITTLLSDHFKASGGKDRALTLDVMERVCETRALGQVDERDYDKLAQALLHDIARYKHGVKKPK